MYESDISHFEDINGLAFKEFISLLNADSSIPEDWKDAFRGCSINDYQAAMDYFETIFASGETRYVENKATEN